MKSVPKPPPQIAVDDPVSEQLPAGDITVLTIDASGTVLFVNADFERSAGCSRYAVLGRRIADLRAGRNALLFGIVQEALQDAETHAGTVFHERVEMRGRLAEISVFPVVDSVGCISQFVAVKRDVGVQRDWPGVHGETCLDRKQKWMSERTDAVQGRSAAFSPSDEGSPFSRSSLTF